MKGISKFLVLGVLVLIALPMLVACGPAEVKVSLTSYAITMDKNTVPPGDVIFHLTNDATDQKHEFVIFKTDLAPDKMPKTADNNIDEEGAGVTHIDEKELEIGESADLKVKLDAGHYVLICNMPGHFNQGMFVEFDVK